MEPTIYDVARLAGVSLSTVSRVLNGYPHVRPATRERVLQAIEELKFKPSLVASALATRQSRTLGLLVSDISNPFFAEIARGVEAAGAAQGFSLVICNTDDDPEREARHLTHLRQKGVDGIVFASALLQDSHAARLMEGGCPLVLISREVEGISTDFIRVDDFQGGYLATRHLIGLGHRRIAHVAGPAHTRPGRDRRKGYEAALEEASLPVDPSLIAQANFTMESGYAAAEALLDSPGPRPTAFFCGNDLAAIGVMRSLVRRGLKVPHDVSLVGYDRTVLATLVEPELTSVAQPMQEMAHRAVEMLMERLRGDRREPLQVVLPPRLVSGGSTGPCPS